MGAVERLALEVGTIACALTQHHTGNKVVQCLWEYGSERCRSIIQGQISPHMVKFAKCRIGNFVVQRVLESSNESDTRQLLQRLAQHDNDLFDVACSRGGSRLLLEAVDREDEKNEAVVYLRAKLTEILPRICRSKYGHRVADAFCIASTS